MNLIVISIQTTWLNPYEDSIIEIWMNKIDIHSWQVIDKMSTMINPWFTLPEEISLLTWIKDGDLKNKPYFDDFIDDIVYFIWDDSVIIWNNGDFITKFLNSSWLRLNESIVFDLKFLSNIFIKNLEDYSIPSVYKYFFGENNINFNRVSNWTESILKILKIIQKEMSNLSDEDKSILSFILSKSTYDLSWFFTFFKLKNEAINDTNFSNILLKKIKKIPKSELYLNDDINFIEWSYFDLSSSNLEVRDNQKQMWEIIWDSLVKDKKVVIEAPTWVWKTFAYLLPSIKYSLLHWERIVVSTKTKALQDQIIDNDSKILHNLWFNFSIAKLKWKSNYLSIWQYLNTIIGYWHFSLEELSTLSKIYLWLLETESWDFDELTFAFINYDILSTISSDNSFTLSEDNPYRFKEFLYLARRNSENSNIVVVNHSLLIQDLKSDWQLFSDVDNFIIDEAHSLEDVSTEALKISVSYDYIENIFSNIESIFKDCKCPFWDFSELKEDLLFEFNSFFELFSNYYNECKQTSQNTKSYLLGNDFYAWNNYLSNLSTTLSNKISLFIDKVWALDDDLFMKISFLLDRLESVLSTINILSSERNTDNIKFIYQKSSSDIIIWYTPLSPSKILEDNFWSKKWTIVLTSATLRTSWSFNYINDILWLSLFHNYTFNSDFDYSSQWVLFIPNDLGSIKSEFNIFDFIFSFIKIIWWNALILSTSYLFIRNLSLFIKKNKPNINILAQTSKSSKTSIIKNFRNNSSNSIIIWTDTFWEGVDIPWDDLKYLIISKLPFPVPDDPVFIARSSLYNNPFLDYALPKAILKLRQWFWRLIRSKSDKWVVILLDDRILNATWWKEFYSAFPDSLPVKVSTSDKILKLFNKQ